MARKSPQLSRPRQRRSQTRYKSSETRRLLKGAIDAGLTVSGMEIDPITGAMRFLFGKGNEKAPTDGMVIETADELRKLI